MSLFLIILYLFCQGIVDRGAADQPHVRIIATSQRTMVDRVHHSEVYRRVVFRIVNKSKKPVIVYGSKYESGFEPIGYIMDRDEKAADWLYPTPDNRPLTWSEMSELKKQKYILKPNKYLTFNAAMSRAEVGKRFRRVVYVSFKDGETPVEVRGEEFVLK